MTKIIETLSILTQSIADGNADALEAYIHLKQVEKKLSDALKEVEPMAYEMASRWQEKTFKYKGAEIQKKNAAGKYDYSNIKQYVSAKEKVKQIEELAKQAAAMAKTGNTVVDENGEVVEPAIYTEGKGIISVRIL